MSVYEPVFNPYISDPWKPFNDAAQRRQRGELDGYNDPWACQGNYVGHDTPADEEPSEKENEAQPWTFLETFVDKGPLTAEDLSAESNRPWSFQSGDGQNELTVTEKPLDTQSRDKNETECTNSSDSQDEESNYGDDQESFYDESVHEENEEDNTKDKEKKEKKIEYYTGPDEYYVDLYEISGVNPLVEEIIDFFDSPEGVRPSMEWRQDLAAEIEKHKARAYKTAEEIAAEEEASPEESRLVLDLPPHDPVYDEVRKRRSEKKLSFGNTRVIRFDKREIVAKEGSEAPKAGVPGKSILKNEDEQFLTPNYDQEIVGDSELFSAIGRLYNLCGLPLEVLDRGCPAHSVRNAALGFMSALKTQEICWQVMKDEEVYVRDKALEGYEKGMRVLEGENEALKSDKEALSMEIAELKEKLRENKVQLEDETRESKIDLRMAEEKKRDLKQTIGQMEGLKLDLMEARSKIEGLETENEDLRKEVRNCKEGLQEQREKSRPLLSQIKELQNKVEKEQKCAVDAQQKLASMERYRKESSILQTKIETLEESNKSLSIKSEKIEEGNDILMCKVEILEGTLAVAKGSLKTSRQREAVLRLENQSLCTKLEISAENIAKLVNSNKAHKADFREKFEALERRYAQVVKDCNSRREEIKKTKHEMEKMGETLKDTRVRMGRKRDRNIANVCSENLKVDDSPTDVPPIQNSHVSGRHRFLNSISRRMHGSSAVINASGS